MNKEGKWNVKEYAKKRLKRIAPQYYLSLLVCLSLLPSAAYLSKMGLKNIVTHVLFIHNWFPECHGMINGALWTMGVIVQFYVVAPILYKLCKKNGYLFLLITIAITIAVKWYVYAVYLPVHYPEGNMNFIMGRQLVTALDNFTIGMFVAAIISDNIEMKKSFQYCLGVFFVLLVALICKLGQCYGIHTNNWSGYIWHSLLACAIGGIVFSISFIQVSSNNYITRVLLWISKYEYGIYIWHMLVVSNLIANSAWIQQIIGGRNPKVSYIPLIVLSILVGYVMSTLTEKK